MPPRKTGGTVRTRKVVTPTVAFTSPGNTPAGKVQIRCIVNNVHLGDGRVLRDLEDAFVDPDLAELLVEKGMAKNV